MTEQEWLTSTNLREMFGCVHVKADRRRLRLFACACCRRVWNPFIDPFTVGVVSVAEAFADGLVNERAFVRLRDAALAAVAEAEQRSVGSGYPVHVARSAAHACADDICEQPTRVCLDARRAAADLPAEGYEMYGDDRALPAEFVAEVAAQADLLRDIFGNPFRSAELEPEWLTADVLALSRGIYADRAFDRMPILADALQDAGCDDTDLLDHCREPGNHVRGCWVIDRLLGRA